MEKQNPIRIVHVEDDPDDAAIIEGILKKEGLSCHLICVDTAEDFARLLEKGDIDIILSDHVLPRFSGTQALAMAREKRPEAPFIYVSGKIGEEEATMILKAGATDYVLKDRPQRLPAAIERALDEAAERAALKRAEEERRKIEERHRLLVAMSPDAIFLLDRDGAIVLTNEQGIKIFDYPREEELLGKNITTLVTAQDAGKTTAWLTEILTRPGEVLNMELSGVRANGDIFNAGARARAYFDLQNQPAGIIVVLCDITEMRSLERQFQQAQKMEAVGRLAGGVAHDFNNLLTVILGYSEFLLKNLPKDSGHYFDIQEIKKAGERAAALTRQLLAFSRRQIVDPRALEPNNVLTDLSKMLGRLVGEHVTLELKLAPDAGWILFDPSQLDQIIMNLAVNAQDAMPGGGRLIIGTRNVSLDEEYVRLHPEATAGEYVLIEISDTGAGIPREIQGKIFEPFFTTKEKGKGTGLGLAMVYGAVKQAGGHVSFYSETGLGTTFRIYLKRLPEGEVSEKKPMDHQTYRGRGETILLVEDYEPVRRVTARMLAKNGYQVIEAQDGEEALALFKEQSDVIVLVLTDVVMPRMNGVELGRRLSGLKSDVKIIYISGYTDDILTATGVLQNGLNLIGKPFEKERLLQKIRTLLDG